MKANEIRDMNNAEMEQKIAGLKEELFNLRFQIATANWKTRCEFVRSKSYC